MIFSRINNCSNKVNFKINNNNFKTNRINSNNNTIMIYFSLIVMVNNNNQYFKMNNFPNNLINIKIMNLFRNNKKKVKNYKKLLSKKEILIVLL